MTSMAKARIAMEQAAYRFGPFVLETPFPVPELPLAGPAEPTNVRVRYGSVPLHLADVGTRQDVLEVSPREALLRITGVAQILVRDGREVVIQTVPGAPEDNLRAYLLAAAFGVLCHQNGMLPLHASAIQIGSGASSGVAAFLGDSGAGKSTLAAFLGRRGHPVLCDDICLLCPPALLGNASSRSDTGRSNMARSDMGRSETSDGVKVARLDPAGLPLVVPVAPWMKLWRGSLEQLGRSAADLPRVFSDDDKYRVRIDDLESAGGSAGAGAAAGAAAGPAVAPASSTPLPLKQIFVLEWLDEPGATVRAEAGMAHDRMAQDQGGARTEIESLDTLHAIHSMVEYTYQPYLIEGMGRGRQCFELCGQALSGAKAFRVRRPRSFQAMERVLDDLERHFQATAL